jgi:hypothetical protein
LDSMIQMSAALVLRRFHSGGCQMWLSNGLKNQKICGVPDGI